jgi:ATP-binding cassette subfamily C protein
MGRAEGSGIAALLRDYRRFAGRRLWLVLALMIFGALAEGFGLLMIVPLATIAINGGQAALLRFAPFASSWTGEQRFIAALVLFVAAMGARALLLFARDVMLARMHSDYEVDLRLRAAATLASRGWPFASRIGQGGMQALLLSDVPRAAQASAYMQSIALAATMLLVQLGLALFLSPALTAIALVFLLAGFAALVRVTARGVRSGFAISQAMEQSAASGFRVQAGLKAALAQGTVPSFVEEYRSSLGREADRFTDFARDFTFSRQLAAFGAAVVAAVLLLVGVRLLHLPFPVLITSLILFARMSAPAQMLQNSLLQAAALAPSFVAIERRLGGLEGRVPATSAGEPLKWSRLELDNVSYEHQPGLGLHDGSLQLASGQWLGLRGFSGAGKTTLVDIVAGLLSPERGSVTVDGRLLSGETLDCWRVGLAYVGQDGAVFNDSVRGNLTAEGGSADEASLWNALETVGLAERVRAFGRGLDESVGDRGSQLSGGERQRLVLARALLRRPSLLILDEATAALDADGEAVLIEGIKALKPRPAALVIAHRESTLSHCDSVLSIQHGVVKAG